VKYRIAGLSVESEPVLPGLIADETSYAASDVQIRYGSVLRSFDDDGAERGPTWEILGPRFLLRIPGVARFLLIDGRQIVVELEADADAADAGIFLLGTVFGILLHQRGRIVLHASAVEVDGRAVLFLGPSGAGKSTMAAALGLCGFPLVSDDLCAIAFDGGGQPMVQPDGRQLKLWDEAVEHLDMSGRRGDAVRSRLQKFYVDPDEAVMAALPVGAVYALREARPPDRPGIAAPNMVDAALILRRNAYRPFLVRRMGQKQAYFQAAAAISAKAGVFDLTRPLDLGQMPEIIGWLERHWAEIGLTGAV
jgi:hypothetical protein